MQNRFIFKEDNVIIVLSRRKKEDIQTIIDFEGYETIKDLDYVWVPSYDPKLDGYYVKGQKYIGLYPNGNPKYKYCYLHRLIVNAPKGKYVDHINHDTLDNRKINLRIVEGNKNSSNRDGANKNNITGVRNVHLVTRYGGKQLYLVQIMRKGERFKWEFELNEFEEACRFAESKRLELFGEYAGNS